MKDSQEDFEKKVKIGRAAKILGVTKTTLRNWDERDILKPFMRLPGKGDRVYTIEKLKNFIKKHQE